MPTLSRTVYPAWLFHDAETISRYTLAPPRWYQRLVMKLENERGWSLEFKPRKFYTPIISGGLLLHGSEGGATHTCHLTYVVDLGAVGQPPKWPLQMASHTYQQLRLQSYSSQYYRKSCLATSQAKNTNSHHEFPESQYSEILSNYHPTNKDYGGKNNPKNMARCNHPRPHSCKFK